jgi:hypothetical protein
MENPMNNDFRRARAIEHMQSYAALLDTYKVEKQHVDAIIDQALNYPSGANRWPALEALKRQAMLIVGWDASLPELTSSAHYEQMIRFIDHLLPQTINEDETPQSTLYIDEHRLEAWCQHADHVLTMMQEQRLLVSPKTEQRAMIDNVIDRLSLKVDDNEETGF